MCVHIAVFSDNTSTQTVLTGLHEHLHLQNFRVHLVFIDNTNYELIFLSDWIDQNNDRSQT